MDRTEECELMTLALAGDIEARNKIVMSFSAMVYKKALSVKGPTSKKELHSVGMLRILEQFHTFRPELGYRASTYFVRVAYRAMTDFVNYKDRIIKFPKEPAAFKLALARYREIDTLDKTDKYGQSFGSQIEDRPSKPPDEEIRQMLHKALRVLSEKERFVVRKRLEGLTLQTIGNSLGCCRERIRQIEKSAYTQLREVLDVC